MLNATRCRIATWGKEVAGSDTTACHLQMQDRSSLCLPRLHADSAGRGGGARGHLRQEVDLQIPHRAARQGSLKETGIPEEDVTSPGQ
ncbi:hypothetical protein E2C01_083894 [Portunus trituberculatus]|uniref:Uncharacterized protein n=1 Tax=Portunus trituberculatus TaxID=210409 RepID=A0A5B7J617_PORTR|nr:hypothetical protein [Portunus trituberculatus]